ncbi:MAG: DUF1257 domain-containing protein [bacterium]|nr:DUF1257 domain-containing protein [bacterium]
MSHKTKIKTKLNNLEYIKKGMTELGYEYTVGENLKTSGNYGVNEKVDILIHKIGEKPTNDAVGFRKESDGTYTAIGDFYGLGINEKTMRNHVTTMAKKCEVNDKLAQLGFDLQSSNSSGGKLELNFKSYN